MSDGEQAASNKDTSFSLKDMVRGGGLFFVCGVASLGGNFVSSSQLDERLREFSNDQDRRSEQLEDRLRTIESQQERLLDQYTANAAADAETRDRVTRLETKFEYWSRESEDR